ncbi:MAG: hypothetical protein AB7S26_07015 [Sandaracinaceae bacterium]
MLARAFGLTSLALLLGACGARSTLSVPHPFDAGASDAGPRPDGGGRDAGLDAGPPMIDAGPSELTARCGRADQYTSPRRTMELVAETEGPSPVVSEEWSLLDAPPGAMTRLSSLPPGDRAELFQDTAGDYHLRFDAMDATGARASCEVTVHSVVGPPVALCPEMPLRTTVGTPLEIIGDGYDDDMVVGGTWAVLTQPPGARVDLQMTMGLNALFTSDTRGTHTLELTVFDPDMAQASCTVDVLVTGPPEVRCPMSPIRTPTRQTVRVTASATDDVGIASRRWELLSRPPTSVAAPSPTDMDATQLAVDKQGSYVLRYTAFDVEGLSASCEVTVIGEPSPPTVTCPAVVTTTPLTPVTITANAVDDGSSLIWRWMITDLAPGSTAAPPVPPNAATTVFTPDIAGVYRLTVTATDEDGMSGMCTTRVDAGNVDGLRIEMFWDTDSTDMDLHLLNPMSTGWGGSGMGNTCYFSNCTRGTLDWGGPGADDNPRLDIDDTTGFGPENINIRTPVPGTYRVGVHAFRGSGANRVTVRIYCGGSTTVPRQTFGPVAITDHGGGSSSADLWRVADVTITASGCTIADLSGPGGPNVRSPYSSEQGMR